MNRTIVKLLVCAIVANLTVGIVKSQNNLTSSNNLVTKTSELVANPNSLSISVYGGYAFECDYNVTYAFNPDGTIFSEQRTALSNPVECFPQKNEYEYDEKGNLIRETITGATESLNNEGYFSLINFTKLQEYDYNQDNKITRITYYSLKEDKAQKTELIEYYYDHDGNLSNTIKYHIVNSNKRPVTKTTQMFDNDGKTIKTNEYYREGFDLKLLNITEKQYDTNGRLVKQTISRDDSEELKSTVFLYNTNGQLMAVVYEEHTDHRFEKHYMRITNFEYDSSGKRKSTRKGFWINNVLHYNEMTELFYDENDEIIEEIGYGYNTSNNSWAPQRRVLYLRKPNYIEATSYSFDSDEKSWKPRTGEIYNLIPAKYKLNKGVETKYRARKVILTLESEKEDILSGVSYVCENNWSHKLNQSNINNQ